MTEDEWLACEDVDVLLRHLGTRPSPRELRLLCVACCRRLDDILQHPDAQRAVEVAERMADGACGPDERKDVRRAAQAAAELASGVSLEAGLTFSDSAAYVAKELLQKGALPAIALCQVAREARLKDAGARGHLAGLPRDLVDMNRAAAVRVEREAQCRLIRDVFGNPFRQVAFDPAWRTDTALSLARHAYEARDFSALPILADALQDAGCDADALLTHLRDRDATHVRGCWALDLVLGRE